MPELLLTFDVLVRVVPNSFEELVDVREPELLFTVALLGVREPLLVVVDEEVRLPLLLLFGDALRVYDAGVVLLR